MTRRLSAIADPDVHILTTGVLYVRVYNSGGARRLVPHALAPAAEWLPHIAVLSECAGYVSLLLYDVDGSLVAEMAEIEVCRLFVYDIQPDDESLFGTSFGFHIDLGSAPRHPASFHKRPDSAQSTTNGLASQPPTAARSGKRATNCQSLIVDVDQQKFGKASAIRARQRSKSLCYAASLGYQSSVDQHGSHGSQEIIDNSLPTCDFSDSSNTPPVVYLAAMQAGERNTWISWLRIYAEKPYSDPIPQPLSFVPSVSLTSRVERCLWINICEVHSITPSNNVSSMVVVNGHPLSQSSVLSDSSKVARLSSTAFFFGGLPPIQSDICILVCNMDSDNRTPTSLLGYSQVPASTLCQGVIYDGWYPLVHGDVPTNVQHLAACLPLANNVVPAPRRMPVKRADICTSPGHTTKQYKSASAAGARATASDNTEKAELGCNVLSTAEPRIMPFRSGDIHMQLWYEELVILAPPFYASVVSVLFEEHPTLIADLVAIAPKSTDWLVETTTKIALSNNHAVCWIAAIVRHELEMQTVHDPALLFRGSSTATRVVDTLMKATGLALIDIMIGDIVRDVVNGNYKCEVDPAKLQPGECIEEHWQTLEHLLEALWEGIETAVHCCPLLMRQTFASIRRAAATFYSEHGAFEQVRYSCVSSFVFLRLLCPAMLAPKSFGLVGRNPCASSLRVLTLMAKGIQCTANLTDFALKEPYMQPMNVFVQRCIPKLKLFIDNIADDTITVPDSEAAGVMTASNTAGLLAIDGDRELAALCTFVSSSSLAIQTAIVANRHHHHHHHFAEACPASPTAAAFAFSSVPRQLSVSSSTNTLLGSDLSLSKLAVDTHSLNRGELHTQRSETCTPITNISPTGTAAELVVTDSTQALQKLLHVCGMVQSCVNACLGNAEVAVVDSPSLPTELYNQ